MNTDSVHDLAIMAWVAMTAAGDHRVSDDETMARRAYELAEAFEKEAHRRKLGRSGGPNKEDKSEART